MGKKSNLFFFLAAISSLFVAGSCGIEDYPFLYPVPSGNISVTLTQKAVIRLPAIDLTDYYYFTHFTVYYRIYVSGTYYAEVNSGNMSALNSALSADYTAFLPYTNTDSNINTASIGRVFNDRHYYALTVEGADIDTILGANGLGKTITLDFTEATPRSAPNCTIDNRTYNLQRSAGNGLFRPVPANRYFFNTSDLYAKENITAGINADAADNTAVSGNRYTYAALYIAITGMDTSFSPIYSTPTFIGVFYLPAP